MSSLEENFKSASFEEKIKLMDYMTEKQKRENSEQVKFTCKDFCGKCASYVGTGETNLAFCFSGKSAIIKEEKECLCGQCPIAKTMSLRWSHYCIRGTALELSNSGK